MAHPARPEANLLVKSTRGDVSYFRLFCQGSGKSATATKSTGHGNGTRYCRPGALKLRTGNAKVRVGTTWYAPVTTTPSAYLKQATYKIR